LGAVSLSHDGLGARGTPSLSVYALNRDPTNLLVGL